MPTFRIWTCSPRVRPAVSISIASSLALSTPLAAQESDSSLVTLDRLFNSDEFAPDFLGPVRWVSGSAYVKLEADSAAPGGPDRYDHAGSF